MNEIQNVKYSILYHFEGNTPIENLFLSKILGFYFNNLPFFMSNQKLSEYLGVSVRQVSRIKNKFRTMKIIEGLTNHITLIVAPNEIQSTIKRHTIPLPTEITTAPIEENVIEISQDGKLHEMADIISSQHGNPVSHTVYEDSHGGEEKCQGGVIIDKEIDKKIEKEKDNSIDNLFTFSNTPGKVTDNIDRSKKEEKKIEITNEEETITGNLDDKLSDFKINFDGKIEETIDDIVFTEMNLEFMNTPTVFDPGGYQVKKVENTKQNDDTILTLSNFYHDTSIRYIDMSHFEELILPRKNIFLSYWYNTIDATPISRKSLQTFNDTFYFRCFNWVFRKCLMEKNLHLQPYRFFDVSIDEMMLFISVVHKTLVEENTDRNVSHIEVAKGVLEELQCDRMKLSQYFNVLKEVYHSN